MINTDSKVYMIIGKSFSGKDTLLNKLLKDKEFCEINNIHKLVRLTTRKPRPNEVDGEDYYFISDEEYYRSYKDREDVAVSTFNSEFGRLYYITDFSKLEPDKNYITVGDPDSIKEYKKVLGTQLCVIYLMPPNWEIFRRFSLRDDNSDYSDLKYKEIYRRFVDDTRKFGEDSNTFMANINCIILLGTQFNYDNFKTYVQKFNKSWWLCMGVIIDNTNSVLQFGTKNTNPLNEKYTFTDALRGKINLLNGDMQIDTENESVINYSPYGKMYGRII